jgi:hypothetical protein
MKTDEAKYKSGTTIIEAKAVADKLISSNENVDQSIKNHREARASL